MVGGRDKEGKMENMSRNKGKYKRNKEIMEKINMRKDMKWIHEQSTHSMEQSPSWEADSHSASQEIPRLSCNLKVHYRVHNSPPLVPILSQIHPVHNMPTYFPKIHHNIILPSMPWSSDRSLPSTFPNQNFVRISCLSHACCISRSSRLPWLYHSNKDMNK